MKPLPTVLLAALALGATHPSRAETPPDANKLGCAVAYEQGQRLRKDGRFLAARAQLALCSDNACPAVLRGDCTRWLTEVDLSIPTVVLTARDASGADLSDVRVELDGKLLTTHLDGKPIQVDPGEHGFRFVTTQRTIAKEVTLEAGDKDVRIDVRFGSRSEAEPVSETRGGIPTASWVLAGVGVVGLAGFGYFALDGRAKRDDLDACKPSCDPDDVDQARRSFLIGDVFLAVGISALAGATIVYATSPRERSTGLRVSPALGLGRAGVVGRF